MPLWAADVAMNCPLNWRAVPTAGTIEAAMRRLEVREADADAERQRRAEVEAERQRLGTPPWQRPRPVDETPDDKHRPTSPIPSCRSCDQQQRLGVLRQAQASVDAAHQIIVACDVTAEANDKQQAEPWRLTVAALEQAGIRSPRTPLAPYRRFRPPMIAAITAGSGGRRGTAGV